MNTIYTIYRSDDNYIVITEDHPLLTMLEQLGYEKISSFKTLAAANARCMRMNVEAQFDHNYVRDMALIQAIGFAKTRNERRFAKVLATKME